MPKDSAMPQPSFVDWATQIFIDDAEADGHMPLLLETLEKESESQWVKRVSPVMEGLHLNYVFKVGSLSIYNTNEVAIEIFNALKARLLVVTP
ncbi:MAG: hypothetical protein A2571_00105 [Candidatus Vogelbacteria bacterium RIFOXYD1_FULL_44_32]|uniref:Uncharacterized protein n=1 Tax=Candidatus Vogelbacteria bacterium RIFOXYD1_FULL_44_32 TaxID=1802438 RepID=A0A1G2QE31_9BACT|nr:MAG: hypothetical protein A2571_00105 [Candidatus Vogelbacteria bacterium RIFOXYD1_FULL_44_32]